MDFSLALSALIVDFPKLAQQLTPSEVVSATVERLYDALGHSRVAIWLCGEEKGVIAAHASMGSEATGKVRYAFSEPLVERGVSYGFLVIEIMDSIADLHTVPVALRRLAMEMAIYAQRLRSERRPRTLPPPVAELRPSPAHDGPVLRATSIVASERGIPPADAWMWLLAESALSARTLLSVAEEIVAAVAVPQPLGPSTEREPARKVEFAT